MLFIYFILYSPRELILVRSKDNKYKLTIDNKYVGCFDTIDEAIYYKNAGETMIIDDTELLINEPFDELDEQCFSIALLSLDDMII